jgi:hypothetical protein
MKRRSVILFIVESFAYYYPFLVDYWIIIHHSVAMRVSVPCSLKLLMLLLYETVLHPFSSAYVSLKKDIVPYT